MSWKRLPIYSGRCRVCPRCGQSQPLECFSKHSNRGLQHWCQSCFSEYFRQRGNVHRVQVAESKRRRRLKGRAFVNDYLEAHPCADCGLSEIAVLEFDHLGDKQASLSSLLAAGWSIKRLKDEIARCEVVCVNCHRRRTGDRGSSWRLDPRSIDINPRLLPAEKRNMRLVHETLANAACRDCGSQISCSSISTMSVRNEATSCNLPSKAAASRR